MPPRAAVVGIQIPGKGGRKMKRWRMDWEARKARRRWDGHQGWRREGEGVHGVVESAARRTEDRHMAEGSHSPRLHGWTVMIASAERASPCPHQSYGASPGEIHIQAEELGCGRERSMSMVMVDPNTWLSG